MNLLPLIILLVSQSFVSVATVYFFVKVLKTPLKEEGE